MAHAESISAQLDFVPYVSSYLPYKEGKLFFGNKGASGTPNGGEGHGPMEVGETLGVQVRQSSPAYTDIPVIDKFEMLRRNVLHLPAKKRSEYARRYYDPKAESWEGVCNQWSAASLEPQISKLVKNLGDINCAGIALNPQEVRELFTAFYIHVDDSKMVGSRSNTRSFLRDYYENQMGLDDLSPEIFHRTLYDNIKKNQGVVIDKDHGPEVWNHPVYKAESNIDVKDKYENLDFVEKMAVPLDAVESDDPQIQETITNLRKEESNLKKKGMALIKRQHREPRFYEVILEESEQVQQKQIDALNEGKIRLISSRKLRLKSGYKIKSVSTTVHYLLESGFMGGGLKNDLEHLENKSFSYVIVEKDGAPVDSRWLSISLGRPDFMWIPSQKIMNNETFRKYSEDMKDLISILENCDGLPGKK